MSSAQLTATELKELKDDLDKLNKLTSWSESVDMRRS